MLGIKGRKCRPATLPCMANHTSISFPSDKIVAADSRCYCGTPRRSQRPPREKSPENAGNYSTDDQSNLRTFGDDVLGGQNTQEEAPEAQLDFSNYYVRELQWKNNEIDLLKRQLVNSAKLVKFYKNKILAVDQPMNDNNNAALFELDKAVQDSISGIISCDW